MDYQPIVPGKHAKPAPEKHSIESRYWRSFKSPVFVKEYAPVTSIHFAQSKPHRYAVTAATRVHIYAPRTQKITKTIARFKDVARSGFIRDDGKLLVAGDDSGLIQVSYWSFDFEAGVFTPLIWLDFRRQLTSYSPHSRFPQAARARHEVLDAGPHTGTFML
jgi:hypothetical protein